jgi:hypothetical protein
MKNLNKYFILFIFYILFLDFCLVSQELTGGDYKMTQNMFQQGGEGSKPVNGSGYLKVRDRLGLLVGNIYFSGGDYTISPLGINYESNTGRVAANNLDNAHVYPNPFKLSKGHTYINFTRLTVEAKIDIYTVSGEWICSLHKDDPMSDELKWNVKNSYGEKVFSGLYVYKIKSGNMIKTGKLIIIL